MDARPKKNVGRCRSSYRLSALRGIGPAPASLPPADAATASRGPAAAPARTPSVVLVPGALAVERPSLGVDLREVEMVALGYFNLQTPRPTE